jgi:hypothetical protein
MYEVIRSRERFKNSALKPWNKASHKEDNQVLREVEEFGIETPE